MNYATVLRVWCFWHLQTTRILCPIDYRIIWFCYKTLWKKKHEGVRHIRSTIIVSLLWEHWTEYLYFRSFWRFKHMMIRWNLLPFIFIRKEVEISNIFCVMIYSAFSVQSGHLYPQWWSELPWPIKIRPRMYVRRSIMYEKAAFCSPEEYRSVTR